MFTTILVALDGSDHANHALTVAMDLAEKYSANLLLLTAVQPIYLSSGGFYPSTAKVMRDIAETQKKDSEQVLAKAQTHVKKGNLTIQVATKLVEGRPADVIIATAQEESVDLIVMGSRGRGGIKQLVLGSVSDRVADGAPCPVLIVRKTITNT